jgi:hypothetical protein
VLAGVRGRLALEPDTIGGRVMNDDQTEIERLRAALQAAERRERELREALEHCERVLHVWRFPNRESFEDLDSMAAGAVAHARAILAATVEAEHSYGQPPQMEVSGG